MLNIGVPIGIGIIAGLILHTIVMLMKLSRNSRALRQLRDQIIEIGADNLTHRLRLENPSRDLGNFIIYFNMLMDLLEKSLKDERHFSANVAHELRNPIAELRNLSEVSLKWPDDKKLIRESMQDVLKASIQMHNIICDLSALAKCDQGDLLVNAQRTELSTFIGQCWESHKEDAERKGLLFETQCDGPAWTITCRSKVELILHNIFSNAVAYSPYGGVITARISLSEKEIALEISNATLQLTQHDLNRMFIRLWRKDATCEPEHHSGLGLAIVKAYCDALGLRIQTSLNDQSVYSIRIKNFRIAESLESGQSQSNTSFARLTAK